MQYSTFEIWVYVVTCVLFALILEKGAMIDKVPATQEKALGENDKAKATKVVTAISGI